MKTHAAVPLYAAANKSAKVTAYADATDFLCELETNPGGMKLYSTKRDCERDNKCTDECGIVELEVTMVRWVKDSPLWKKSLNDKVI